MSDDRYWSRAELDRMASAQSSTESAPPQHDLTPSEVALARVLDLFLTWEPESPVTDAARPMFRTLHHLGSLLIRDGWVESECDSVATPAATALLDRARKAGVLR